MSPAKDDRWAQPGDEVIIGGAAGGEEPLAPDELFGDAEDAGARRRVAMDAEAGLDEGRCPRCGAEGQQGNKRCTVCDFLLVGTSRCPVCGATVDDRTANCPDCGTPNPRYKHEQIL